ncbi:MAG TPA: glucoamylase [Kribbella sp.]|nr:glucoamylase [Kribbella sp.]
MRDDSARRIRLYPVVVIVVLIAVLAVGTMSNLSRNPQPELVAEGIPGRKVPATTTARLPSVHPDLVRHALADLDALTLPSGATLAGWDGPWRFVWPRDASFVAAARCSVGQYAEADRVLAYLTRIRPTSGRWAARYLADSGSPVPDGREAQSDGSGWVLWATWFCAVSRPDTAAALVGLRAGWPMLKQSGDQIVAELGTDGLPQASPDYWERHEPEVTLGTIAPLLAGLRAGIATADLLGRNGEADRWRAALSRLSTATDRTFGPDYPRTPAQATSTNSELGGATQLRTPTTPRQTAGLDNPVGVDNQVGVDPVRVDNPVGVPVGVAAQTGLDNTAGLHDTTGLRDTLGIGGVARPAGGGSVGIAGGADAIVTVLGPPFAPPRADISAAIERSHDLLTLPNGGVTPGQDWRADGVAWTPQTALFGLSAAARGDRATAESVLTWLDTHRTSTGALPEKVNRENRLAGEAPLGWTCALVILTAAALDTPLPTPAG